MGRSLGIGIGIGMRGTSKKNWGITPDTPTVTINSNTSLTVNNVITGLDKTVTAVEYWGSTDNVTFTMLTKAGSTTSYDHDGLENNSIHYYKVRYWSGMYVSGFSGVASGTTFITAAYTYFAAMSTQLSQAQKLVINAAIKSTATQLAKMDYVNIALATEQQSLINLVNPSQSGTKVNSPTFTAYKGWKGDASNYIDTGYNPGDGGSHNFTQNNATGVLYINEEISTSHPISTAYLLQIRFTASSLAGFICDNVSSGFTNLKPRIGGFFGIRRNSSTTRVANQNKETQSSTVNSETLKSQTLLARYELRSPMLITGAYLTDAELSDFQDAWLPTLEYLGSDYWSNFSDTTLTATPASDSQMDIAWTYPVVTYSPYTIVNAKLWTRETVGTGDWTLLDTFTGSETSYEHTGLDNNSYHEYMVTFESSRGITTDEGTVAVARTINYVDYIQSSGTQYLFPDIAVDNNSRLIGEIKRTNNTLLVEGHWDQDGGAPNTRGFAIQQAPTGNVGFFYGSQVKSTGSTTYLDTFKKVEFGKNVYIDDVLYHTFSDVTAFDANSKIALFARAYKEYTDGYVGNGSVARKTTELYNGVTLQLKYQPALNLLGQFCMFDEVSKTYKLNAGTGIFTGGGLTTAEIDALLIQYADAGVSDVVLDFRGEDNGYRSIASDAAVATLVAAGCTVYAEIGPELITNGDFSAWTSDNPDGWIIDGESGTDPEISEVGDGESHGGTGTGMCNIYTSGSYLRMDQKILTIGHTYRIVIDVNKVTLGKTVIGSVSGGSDIYTNINTAGIYTKDFTAIGTALSFKHTSASDVTINSVSIREIV